MARISILLPSIREDAARRCLALIEATRDGIDAETVLVGPFAIEAPRVRWVEMQERRGVTAAQQAAFATARGDYVVALSDYLLPRPGWLANLVAALDAAGDAPAVLGPLWANAHGGRPGVGFAYGRHYPYFPAASRRTVERIGGWYDTVYRSQWCDCDLALRCWRVGGACDVVWSSVVIAAADRDARQRDPAQHAAKTADADAALFLERWHGVFGADWPRRPDAVNLDVTADQLPHLSLAGLTLTGPGLRARPDTDRTRPA